MSKPAENGFTMVAEWVPHKCTWMGWPCRDDRWGDKADQAREAYADLAQTVAQFEPVMMVARHDCVAEVSLACGQGVTTVALPQDDGLMKDTGPTFLKNANGTVAGADFGFNGWGKRVDDFSCDKDLAQALLEHLKLDRYDVPMILEGGAFETDGEGTLITTEQVVLSATRNEGMTKEQAEAIFKDYLGITTVIWLQYGLEDDPTGGHVNNLVRFTKPGTVVALGTGNDSSDPNHAVMQENLRRLKEAKDAKGRSLEVVEIAPPKKRKLPNGKRSVQSYTNFYIVNGGVIMPAFEDSNDKKAYEVLRVQFSDRQVIQLCAYDLLHGGAGIAQLALAQPV